MLEERKPFEPKDDVAEWRKLYDALKGREYGELVSYDELDEILGRDFRESRGPLVRCNEELVGVYRHLSNVAGEGYRIVQPNEHVRVAEKHENRIKTQTRRVGTALKSANTAALSESERRELTDSHIHLDRIAAATTRRERPRWHKPEQE